MQMYSKGAAAPVNETFLAYASRVKHIALRYNPAPISSEYLSLLPNLTSVTLSRAGCHAPLEWMLSPHLQKVHILIGPMADSVMAYERGTNAAKFLQHLTETYPSVELQRLRIRGWMCSALSQAIIPLAMLRSLSIMSGASLTPQLLRAITTFPFLEDLKVHADTMSTDDLKATTPHIGNNSLTFPRLRTFLISGQHKLIAAVLELLQPGTLERITIETMTPTLNAHNWIPILDQLAAKASSSLIALTLQHTMDPSDLQNLPMLAFTSADITFTMDTLRPLASLKALRAFMSDTSLPPDLSDKDVEEMGRWWPSLQVLNIGTLPFEENYLPLWQAKTTEGALKVLARLCPALETLVIPLDYSTPTPIDTKNATMQPQHALRTLFVGQLSPAQLPSTFVQDVLSLFPSVNIIECDVGQDVKPIYDRNATVAAPEVNAGELDEKMGTEDGFAGGL